jgi:transposase InsO family protein
MSIASRNGSLYAMNIIDDFSSYTWTIPLKHKGDACVAIQTWHKAVENQTDEKLKIILMDNGELLSRDVLKWCSDNGIEHQLTAPYTSSHNGRAERLHRTLLGKARAMRLACNAPASLWDEFVNTASYLTTLTASSTIGGKTPYEVWYGKIPSLSHLQEIGCRAFTLIMTNNPKVLQRSVPCVLIGYAPHSKAYRLWNPASGRVFNSFHISFIEHLDSLPSSLMPGTLLNINDGIIPPTWDAVKSSHLPNPIPGTGSQQSPPIAINDVVAPPLPDSNTQIPLVDEDVSRSPAPSPDHGLQEPPQTTDNSLNSPIINHSTPAPPRRSSRVPILVSRGLLSDSRLANAVSDATLSGLRRKEERNAQRNTRLENLAEAFIADFSNVRESHDLIPIDIDLENELLSIDETIAAISDGTIAPTTDPGDDPSWEEALASPDREYWIDGGRDELKSLTKTSKFLS